MRTAELIRAEYPTPITPEFLRVLSIAQYKERQLEKQFVAACRAWGLLNKFTNPRKKTQKFKRKHRAKVAKKLAELRAALCAC